MNRENIQKVRDHIARLPAQNFSMQYFGLEGPCGTVACIAGWTNILLGGEARRIEGPAGKLLGLDSARSEKLFWCDTGDIDDGGPAWRRRWGASPADAVRVLDHLLETGEVDWSIIDAPSPSSDRGGS